MSDTLDVLTLAEGKVACDISGADSTQNGAVAAAITAVSRRLDRAVGPVVQRTITAERHDGGERCVWLRFYPVASVTTVTEYAATTPQVLTAETIGTAGDTAYLLEPYDVIPALFSGEVYRRSGGSSIPFACGSQNVAVTYVAGRAASTAAVDAIYKQAAVLMLKSYWRSTEISTADVGEYTVPAQSFPSKAVPTAVRDLLADEWQERPGVA